MANAGCMWLLEQLQASQDVLTSKYLQLRHEKELLTMAERRLTAQRKKLLGKNSRLAQEWHQRSEVVACMERSLQKRLNLISSNQEL